MRYFLVNNSYSTEARSGSETVVRLEAERLIAAGHEVIVLRLGDDDRWQDGAPEIRDFQAPQTYPLSEASRHGLPSRLAWQVNNLFNRASAKKFGDLLDRLRPDVVHTHNLMGFGLLIPKEIRARRIRHVHTVHDVQLVNPSGLIPVTGFRLGMTVLEYAYSVIAAALFGSPDRVEFPSEFMRRFHRRHGFFRKSERVVVRNPSPFPTREGRVAPEKTGFLFVGQMVEHKGVMELLAAWKEAGRKDATLEFVGDGPLRRKVAFIAGADSSIVVSGRLNGPELVAAYDRASWVVVPSLVIENSPTAIIEAHCRQVPVLAPRQGGISELLTPSDRGYDPSDRHALTRALKDCR